MPSLYLLQPGARAGLVDQRIRVELPQENGSDERRIPREIPLHDIERIVIEERAGLTTPALCECLRRGIPVAFVSHRQGRMIGQAAQPSLHSATRLAHYDRARDSGFALAVAAAIIEAKILNSRRMLQRLAANRAGSAIHTTVTRMEQDREAVVGARSLDTLRGHEGTAAGRYFEAYGGFFPSDAPFERRSRRPPHNAANALLSLSYSLLAAEAEAMLHTVGLDPGLGFLHEPSDGRASLALDLIEPFRAPVADALALDLLSHGIIQPAPHTERRDGGIFLNADGRRKFYGAYERRMERDFTSEQLGRRTSLRSELQRMAYGIKNSINAGEILEPFLMN